jgi:hypothetical protein
MSRPASSSLIALRDRIRHIEEPVRHGVLPFGVAALDCALPGGGLALGAVHEITGAGGDEEDGAAAAGFAAAILARLGTSAIPTSPSPSLARWVPSLSPLKGGEGKKPRQHLSLSARHGPLGGGEGPLPNPPPLAGEGRVGAGGGEGWGEVGDARALGSGPVLWCLKRPDLYGPGLMAYGLDPGRLVLVSAPRDDAILWALEEGLRAGLASGLASVVGEISHLPMVAGRRLQLAAERSGVTALILRRWRSAAEAAAERDRPSAAVTRWRIAALPSADIAEEPGIGRPRPHPNPPPQSPGQARGGEGKGGGGAGSGRGLGIGRPRWRVALLRCRGGAPGIWDVEVADATGHVSLPAELADRPAAPARLRAEPVRRAG